MTQVIVPIALGGDGAAFSDAGESARDMQGQGYAAHFFTLLGQLMPAMSLGVAAAASALTAPGTMATSTTSLTLSAGTKALTIQTGKALSPGQRVALAYTTTPTKQMSGIINSYDAGTGALSVEVAASDVDGSGTYALWSVALQGKSGPSGVIGRTGVTGATTLDATHKAKLVDVTSGGSFTLAATACATLGEGWWCALRNSQATGVVTLVPSGAETTDGLGSIRIYPRESFILSTEGTNLRTIGRARLVSLGAVTVSGAVASVDFETGFDDAELDQIIIRGYKITHNGAVTRAPWARTKHAGAYVTSGTYDAKGFDVQAAAVAVAGGAAQTRLPIGSSVAVGAYFNTEVRCTNLAAAGNGEHGVEWASTQPTVAFSHGAGSNSSGSALQGLRILMSGDSITAGTFYSYGVRK